MTENDHDKISMPKLILSAAIKYFIAFIFVFLLLFLPAGSLQFWNAWLFIAVLFLMMLYVLIYLILKDPELLQKRIKTKEKEKTQKIYLILSIITCLIAFIIPGLDYKYHWSSVPLWLIIAGTIIMISGYTMFFITMKQNTYASRVIEIQEGQKVIDSGLYSVVRHPLYMSASILYCSTPFVLGSFYALIPIIFVPLLLIIRIMNEEKVLKKNLNGYEEYMKKVKYRLVPFIW